MNISREFEAELIRKGGTYGPKAVLPQEGVQEAQSEAFGRDGRPITEKAFMSLIERLARQCGFLVYHTHDSRRSEPGFPDLVLVKPPLVIFAELKTDKGKPSEEQMLWLEWLGSCDRLETCLWRPRDLGEIVKLLSMQAS